MKRRNVIVNMAFGSHLYGTATPSSDMDYKGVFIPDAEMILLGRIPKSIKENTNKSNDKNTKDDVDLEFYSLHYFVKLACMGETVALDMLHAPSEMIIEHTPIWASLVEHRAKFYTKNLKAFVGYARRQAAKYGIKGSRLNDAKRVIETLETFDGGKSLAHVWGVLPEGEHVFKHPADQHHNGLRMYEVCGRKVQETASVEYTIAMVRKFYEAYGARARMAAENQGIDWKAVSHALRAAYQVKELLTEGTITFPRPEATLLKNVKKGVLDYTTLVAPLLDMLMDQVEEASEKSLLPEKVDRGFWNEWLFNTVRNSL